MNSQINYLNQTDKMYLYYLLMVFPILLTDDDCAQNYYTGADPWDQSSEFVHRHSNTNDNKSRASPLKTTSKVMLALAAIFAYVTISSTILNHYLSYLYV